LVSIPGNIDFKYPWLRREIMGCSRSTGALDDVLFEGDTVVPGPLRLRAFRHEEQGVKFKRDTIFDIDRTMDRRAPLIQKASSLKLHLSHIDAAFICSGPFRLMLTLDLEQHLVLGNDGFLRVYWDFEASPGGRLVLFKNHFLWDNK
jgi:hypothetical protein